MTNFTVTGEQFQKLVLAHKRYLATYAFLNKGSLEGATPFHKFFVFQTYTQHYADPRACAPMGYR